jgi:hypothetical protein
MDAIVNEYTLKVFFMPVSGFGGFSYRWIVFAFSPPPADLFTVLKKRPDLFKRAPGDVQKLAKQAQKELRLKKRAEWWAHNQGQK